MTPSPQQSGSMRSFRDLSIRHKLTLITMVTSAAALLLACAAFAFYDLVTFRQTLVEQVWTQAGIISANSTAAVTFDDAPAAADILGALRAARNIEGAAIYNKDGRLLAQYARNHAPQTSMPPAPEAEGYSFSRHRLTLFHRIVLDGSLAGWLYLRSDLHALRLRMAGYAGSVSLILLSAGLLAWLLSRQFQRVISQPIEHLAETAHAVCESRDYSVRAHKRGHDEMGRLIDAFNDMLSEIQSRDRALQAAHEQLEERARLRTADLQQEVVQRTRAEDALRHSEKMLRTMTAGAPDAIITGRGRTRD